MTRAKGGRGVIHCLSFCIWEGERPAIVLEDSKFTTSLQMCSADLECYLEAENRWLVWCGSDSKIFEDTVCGPQNVGKIFNLSGGHRLLFLWPIDVLIATSVLWKTFSPVLVLKYARINKCQNWSQNLPTLRMKGRVDMILWLCHFFQYQRYLYSLVR